MKKELLTMTESKALRGLAILGIVLHNYCHFMKFAVKENEYTFTAGKAQQFLEKLLAFDSDLFIHFFSFLGHYGVPVFLFISGYGLVMKYENGAGMPGRGGFIRYHYLKLFRLMILGYLLFVAVYFLRMNNGATVYSWDRVVAQLSMTINFVYPSPDKIIKPGPYWYFGLMMQLYILYALLLNRWRSKYVVLLAVAVCWALQWGASVWQGLDFNLLNYLRYNFIGAVLPFGVGILYGRRGQLYSNKVYAVAVVVSAVAVLLGSLWFHGWLWVPLFVVIGAVSTVKLLPKGVLEACAWVGNVSAALFVMHPLMREIILPHFRKVDIYYGIAVYLLASVALSMLLMYVLKFIPNPRLKP